MTATQIFLVVVVAVPLGLALANRLRVDLAALVIAAALGTAQFFGMGVLGPAGAPGDAAKAISGFGQPVVITLVGLFILTRGLEKSGITRWIAQKILAAGGGSESRLIGLFAATTALLSLFMNNLAAGALILPSAMEAARRSRLRPSKLLIPVAFGSLLGGSATYFTTANIIVSGLLPIASPPQRPLNFLDFTPTGGLIAVVGILFLAFFGKRLLPDRVPASEQLITRPSGAELEDLYQLHERLWEARVQPGSPLVGKTLAQSGIGERLGLAVAAIWHADHAVFSPPPAQAIRPNDILLLVGREERVEQLAEQGVSVGREPRGGYISPRPGMAVAGAPQGVTFIEVMLSPHSPAGGQSLKDLDFRRKYGFTAVALWHAGRSIRTNVADYPVEFGDSLLMIGPRDRVAALAHNPDFIVLEPSHVDEPVDRRMAAISVGVIAAAVAVSIAGFPVYLAVLAGAVIAILLGVLNPEEAYRSVEWTAIFLIAGMYTISLAMVQTGLADLLGRGMIVVARPGGALGLAAGAYLLSALLTQVMGGQVTALVSGPIAISAALAMGVNPQAVAVAAAIGCSASFLTPFAHPVNILMVAPASYTFSDFTRIGWRLSVLCFIALVVGLVVFWGL
jgi:di/tricarboxylate transporter